MIDKKYVILVQRSLTSRPFAGALEGPIIWWGPYIKIVKLREKFEAKWKMRNGILLPKLFLPTVRKKCSSDQEKQFNQTVKRQKIFW